jgi:hypothetical protein
MGDGAVREPHRRRSLRARLSIVAVAYLALFLICSVVAAITVHSWNESVEHRGALRLMRDDVNNLRLALSDQESGVNGHMRSDNVEYLVRYHDGIARETSALERLEPNEQLVDGAPSELDRVRAAARSWRVDAAEPQIEQRAAGSDIDPALIALGRIRFDEVRDASEDLASDVDAKVGDAEDRVTSVSRTAVIGMLTAFSAALACTVVAMWLFRRWVTKPLADISTAARAIAGGQLAAMPTFDTRSSVTWPTRSTRCNGRCPTSATVRYVRTKGSSRAPCSPSRSAPSSPRNAPSRRGAGAWRPGCGPPRDSLPVTVTRPG